jgi:endonuclease/exonuclease/phosphatase family protein
MRIVVWNCAMALHTKLDALYVLKPDIAVISECANPEIVDRKSETGLPQSTVWVGDNQQKVLAVLAFGEWRAELDDSYDPALRILAPVLINGPVDFRVLAAWSFNRRQDLDSQRRGPLRAAAEDRSLFLNQPGPLIVAGDFNSNAVFKQYRGNSPSGWITGDLLEGLGLISSYHYHVGCEYGKEPDPTIYWRNRTADGPVYHIDYCFVPREWTGAIMNVELGRFDDWVANGLSDHVPLIIDLDEGAIAP